MEKPPLVSVVIPCRNEQDHVADCLRSLARSDYPSASLEILLVDGMSDDNTRAIVQAEARQIAALRLIDNPSRTTPAALNAGIREARGDYVIILGSHTIVQPDFVSKNVDAIEKHEADCVGGVLETLPGDGSLTAFSIAKAMSSRFGIGNSYFRTGSDSVRTVDTVPFGCYRKSVFEKMGLFDEDLIRNQDDEFNFRIVKNGGKVVLVPGISTSYFARKSLGHVWRMYFQYGLFKPLVAGKLGKILTWRQLAPPAFVAALAVLCAGSLVLPGAALVAGALLATYLLANLGFSAAELGASRPRAMLLLPIAYSTLHFSYGMGYLWGALRLAFGRETGGRDMPLSR